ncbi:MAG: xylulokinase [Acholeplasmataceae bacterium]
MYIGVDLGTSGVKVILIDEKGDLKAKVSKNYPLLSPKPGWTEQDPEGWYKQAIIALGEAVNGYEQEIKAIAFSGQMHGMVVLDQDDQVIRPAILWNDQRTQKEVETLNEKIGVDCLLTETGNIALTGLTAPKILWLKNNEPINFAKINKIMLPKDYLAYKLSGVFATDVSDVSGTLYFDVKNRRYSKVILDFLGIKESQLPKVFESSDVIGTLKADIARQLGLANDVKIIIGGGDQAVGAVGVGTVVSGKCSISLGTSGVVYVATDAFSVDRKSYLQSYRDATGNYHMMGVILNAAGALKWWTEGVFKEFNYDDLFFKLNQTPIDDTLYFLPYLNGERAPINDPKAKGVFFGLTMDHRKEHMDRAVVEGITYALKESFDLISDLGHKIEQIRITGGGARSAIWAQMIADICQVKVETIKIEEGPAFGAALLAIAGFKKDRNIAEICEELIEPKQIFLPNEENFAVYSTKYKMYLRLYPVIKNLY